MLTEAFKARIAQAISPLPGWCSQAKAEALANLVLEHQAALCVEIGVFGGRSLVPLGMACQHQESGCAVGIDAWQNAAATEGNLDQVHKVWWEEKNMPEFQAAAAAALAANGLAEWAFLLWAKAEHCHVMFASNSIDLLHIDGNHSEESSTRDVNLWLPKVRRGGHIVFDDVNWGTTGCALRLLTAACDTIGDIGECRIFRRS